MTSVEAVINLYSLSHLQHLRLPTGHQRVIMSHQRPFFPQTLPIMCLVSRLHANQFKCAIQHDLCSSSITSKGTSTTSHNRDVFNTSGGMSVLVFKPKDVSGVSERKIMPNNTTTEGSSRRFSVFFFSKSNRSWILGLHSVNRCIPAQNVWIVGGGADFPFFP